MSHPSTRPSSYFPMLKPPPSQLEGILKSTNHSYSYPTPSTCCSLSFCRCHRRGSWWSSSRGTIRVAVSLERLQANIIRAALPPNRAPVGVPLGAGVGAGGVARAAVQEAKGVEALPPAELSCKVCVGRGGGRGEMLDVF